MQSVQPMPNRVEKKRKKENREEKRVVVSPSLLSRGVLTKDHVAPPLSINLPAECTLPVHFKNP
jgi:hypothetical protein